MNRREWSSETTTVDTTAGYRRTRATSIDAMRNGVSGRHSPDAIDYAVTIDDPKTFTNTWTIGVPLKQDKEQTEIFEYACHEGNYAMRNILSSARADEKAARKHSVRLNPYTTSLRCQYADRAVAFVQQEHLIVWPQTESQV
jgi:hypothetical protein